ncbi:hypothetical protein JCM17844_05320 [Iodidimonas gelatinilytica]|uniref:DUF1579 domain-containing protein n=1 Tax=Iodidimonas gelatinilytica TaxID=1236966 RepID=A0A5A7MPH9_9PROT|nr:hypothetical protein [Iodidimonas gelatinilytica]GEQ96895.1 hypothetical protein JCM17844_05320 [Iodidimonas gelatinilytica]
MGRSAFFRMAGAVFGSVFFLMGPSGISMGQESVSPPSTLPAPVQNICEGAEFSQFDFWLGHWQVMDRSNDHILAGTNHIEKLKGGCALLEHWTAQSGGSGESLTYYDPTSRKWRQIWIAVPGYLIDISGSLIKPGVMRLEGFLRPYSGAESPFRGTWTANDDGSVRQFFEIKNGPPNTDWSPWFDGLYKPLSD